MPVHTVGEQRRRTSVGRSVLGGGRRTRGGFTVKVGKNGSRGSSRRR